MHRNLRSIKLEALIFISSFLREWRREISLPNKTDNRMTGRDPLEISRGRRIFLPSSRFLLLHGGMETFRNSRGKETSERKNGGVENTRTSNTGGVLHTWMEAEMFVDTWRITVMYLLIRCVSIVVN